MVYQLFNAEQEQYIKDNYGKIRADDIAKHLGAKRQQIIRVANRLGCKSQLTKSTQVTEEVMRNHKVKLVGKWYGPRHAKTEFLCPYCNAIFLTTPYKVFTGHTKTCGCVNIARRKGTKHVSADYWRSLKDNANARNLTVEFGLEDLEDLIVAQNHKCALSGLPIQSYGHRRERTASLDRIDSSKHYTLDNVQWLHKSINLMKQSFGQEEFVEFCKRVAENAS